MASGAEAGAARESGAAVDGTGHGQADASWRARRDAPTAATAMARVGVRPTLHRPCRGADDGKITASSRLSFNRSCDSHAGFPKRWHAVTRSTRLYTTTHRDADTHTPFGGSPMSLSAPLWPVPITRACRAWSAAELSHKTPTNLPRSQWASNVNSAHENHQRACSKRKSFRPW